MEFCGFYIKNFKGITDVELNLNKQPKGNVYTLIGLNESGKTTILEAISYIFSGENPTDYSALFDKATYSSLDDPFDLIPLGKADNFNDDISVTAKLLLNDEEITALADYVKREFSLILDQDALKNEIEIEKNIKFSQSTPQETKWYWTIKLQVKKTKKGKFRQINSSEDAWKKIVSRIKEYIPTVFYFPTFLFDFPKKIYLQDCPTHDAQRKKINSYYREIIREIIKNTSDYTGNDSIQELILDRMASSDEKRRKQVKSLLSKISLKISQEIFELWNEIFNQGGQKAKKLDIQIEQDKNNLYYLEFNIQEGSSLYSISQRSLGFKWFFCFLLFTHLRLKEKHNDILFLFDEPASNLHSSAQTQLLTSFTRMIQKGVKIIYSTHSQYLINPKWLENAYIIENKALTNTEKDIDNYRSTETDIKAVLYKEFAHKNPTKTTYFQPILDLLNYQPSVLECIPDVFLFEGKTDFYVLNYFVELLGENLIFNPMPGSGVDKLDSLISLYLGWGKDFIIVVDGDSAGERSKKVYMDDYLLSENQIITLKEIDQNWKAIESLITIEDQKALNGGEIPNKKQLHRLIQEKLIKKDFSFKFSTETCSNFSKLIKELNKMARKMKNIFS